MKKLAVLITSILIFSNIHAQNSDISRLVNTYRGEEDVVSLFIPGFLCRLAAQIGDCSEEEELLLRSIQSVRILVIENPRINRNVNFVSEIDDSRWGEHYKMLLNVQQKDEDVRIYASRKNGKVRELIILVSGEENVLVRVKGRMHTDLLHALGGIIEVEAAKHTREIKL